jgi:predicted GIY-YIG superfamily endonuclease
MSRDCSAYVIAKNDMLISVIDDTLQIDFDINEFKSLYIGISNDIERRQYQHSYKEIMKVLTNKRLPKLDTHIRANGWNSYKLIVIKTGMTREEACLFEIDTIAKYRTFELGLNSTPGGDGAAFGSSHPLAQAVNVYNNSTAEIRSFELIKDAALFLGVERGRVSAVVDTTEYIKQCFSPVWNTYVQVRRAHDETPFIENMPIPNDIISEKLRTKIILYNIETNVETEYDGIDTAALSLNIFRGNIDSVLQNRNNQFTIEFGLYKGRYDAQYFPKTREWNVDILPSREIVAIKNRKEIIIINIDTRVETQFYGINKAAEFLGIERTDISKVINGRSNQFYVHDGIYKGRFDAQYFPKTREWNIDVLPRFEASALAKSEAVVAYDEDGNIVYEFVSGKAAQRQLGIGGISACASHKNQFAGRTTDGQQLRWEFKDREKRVLLDQASPRKNISNRVYYILDNKEHVFVSITEAVTSKLMKPEDFL